MGLTDGLRTGIARQDTFLNPHAARRAGLTLARASAAPASRMPPLPSSASTARYTCEPQTSWQGNRASEMRLRPEHTDIGSVVYRPLHSIDRLQSPMHMRAECTYTNFLALS